MDNRLFKIYNQKDFDSITKGIKVAKCMRLKSSIVPDPETIFSQLEDLTVSDSLSCSFCNKVFEDQAQQRSHYKLDWHRYNLKQRLRGFKSITEDEFDVLADEDDVSSLSGSESDPENGSETNSTDTATPKPPDHDSKSSPSSSTRPKKLDRKLLISCVSSDSEPEETSEAAQRRKHDALTVTASRHSKVFFENSEGDIFSIYRCLLHSKKSVPSLNDEIISQALNSGKRSSWTVIMVGGGHFAAAVFQDGEALVHKTFHTYTVRAKQGSSQSQRDNRGAGYQKSAGASLRRYNESLLIQHVQEILDSWGPHITNSSLILYRAVGPQNRTVLFGGKNPPLDKTDPRLRPLPFPTRRATFSEVQRVYDVLTTVEVYGSASDFTDSFPISPRQPIRKKIPRVDLLDEIPEQKPEENPDVLTSSPDVSKGKSPGASGDRHKSPRTRIDRAKARKSPSRPLPDIIARLAMSSSESDADVPLQLFDQICEIDFTEDLLAFEDTAPRHIRQKKIKRQRKKVKKDKPERVVNRVLEESKMKLWAACMVGDVGLLNDTWEVLIGEVKRWEKPQVSTGGSEGYPKSPEITSRQDDKNEEDTNDVELKIENVLEVINEGNDDGNTLLHLAAVAGHLDVVWLLMEMGANPCRKNKKCQTPYAATAGKEARNTFRRFMAVNPDKFDYQKSQIPAPLTEEIEMEEMNRKRVLRKAKREKERAKKREFEMKKQEENSKQRFLNLSDREKRALAAEQRILKQNGVVVARCFQCAADMSGTVPFEYNSNRFCSMPCLKEHRLHNKFIV
ncbi:ankyrin repeat and zinc finger domain-containing protein 1 [Diachasma alloeum]|uniref:ankyrin repeat and zinc finger domain-containing protein 1 n=1 Tax=Diachasma alloeum TaxID=454923 RepID=UPI000738415E|nr:ankyrin repeat and zinc finger domain-containing protein 1 [Diachasma alloeum]